MTLAKKVSKGVLKAKMLEYFREIERTGIDLIVTDNRKPVLKIVPLSRATKTAESVFKKYRNKVKYKEDINAPTTGEWGEV